MEENVPRPKASGEEPNNRAARPLLQEPSRVTNFYIDTILRPDFGRQRRKGAADHRGDRSELSGRKPPRRDPKLGGETETSRPELTACDPGRADSTEAPAAPAGPAARPTLWPAWVYCTRYSDRPSSGPRSRKSKKGPTPSQEDKRPRTAFSAEQLQRLKAEFQKNRYLTEQRRQGLAAELRLNESQIKIWFQNKRAKIKKASGKKNSLAEQLMAQGLYNHSAGRGARSDSD